MTAPDALAQLFAVPIAHRGLHACGRPGPVENSLSAARAAIAAGYGIECDIQLSRDGEAMVFHDAELLRMTGQEGSVAARDASALAALALGGGADRIPTLAALLAEIDGRVPLVIEIKSDGADVVSLADRAVALVAGYSGIVALESFDPAIVLQCRRAGAPCPVGLVGPRAADSPPDPAGIAASDFLSWDIRRLASVAQAGLPLSTWTVRSEADAALARQHGAQIVFEGIRPGSETAR